MGIHNIQDGVELVWDLVAEIFGKVMTKGGGNLCEKGRDTFRMLFLCQHIYFMEFLMKKGDFIFEFCD